MNSHFAVFEFTHKIGLDLKKIVLVTIFSSPATGFSEYLEDGVFRINQDVNNMRRLCCNMQNVFILFVCEKYFREK